MVCVFYYVADIFLRIEEFNGFAVFLFLVNPAGAFRALAADSGEAGVFPDFDAPALVITEVPVQAVEFIARHELEDALCIGHADGVAAGVKHDSTVLECRVILKLQGWDFMIPGGLG